MGSLTTEPAKRLVLAAGKPRLLDHVARNDLFVGDDVGRLSHVTDRDTYFEEKLLPFLRTARSKILLNQRSQFVTMCNAVRVSGEPGIAGEPVRP